MSVPATAASSRYDCVVIGGGHNGLVCAATLARGGRSVLVLEAANRLGGAALTREFAPGFRVSAGAHLLHLMPAELLRELQLGSHGLEWAAQGKSAWEIGRILGITRRTAGFHLENAKAKLGVHSICQAVARLIVSRSTMP